MEKFNGFSKVTASKWEHWSFWQLVQWSIVYWLSQWNQVNKSMSSRLKLRRFPFRPLITPFVCFSATCGFAPLPVACLLARKGYQLSYSAGLWDSRHQVESLSEVNPNDYLRDSISFREGTLSVQSSVEFVVLMNWSILSGFLPDAYFNLSSRGLTFPNTQFCSLWKLITGLFHC